MIDSWPPAEIAGIVAFRVSESTKVLWRVADPARTTEEEKKFPPRSTIGTCDNELGVELFGAIALSTGCEYEPFRSYISTPVPPIPPPVSRIAPFGRVVADDPSWTRAKLPLELHVPELGE